MESIKIYETWANESITKFQTIVYLSTDKYKPTVSQELNILMRRLYYNSNGDLIKEEYPYRDSLKEEKENDEDNR